MNLRDQFWKCSQTSNRGGPESLCLCETLVNRGDIIVGRELRLFRVNRANPIGKGFLGRDLPAQTRVIEVAMRVNQPGQQRLFAEVDDLPGVARFDLVEISNIDDLISANGDRAILDGWSVHGDDRARANDHSSAVAAVSDRRQIECNPGGLAPPQDDAFLAEGADITPQSLLPTS